MPAVKDLDVVVVTGTWGGPRMWKISKGDHVLWILGTLTPLPAKMTWDSSHAERIVAQAQEVLAAPSVSVSADGIGFFRGLFLIPSLLSVRKNPEDATLKEVLPPDLYARWSVLKKKYIGRDAGIEKWRPLFAAEKLYSKAIEASGLDSSSLVWRVISTAAKRNHVKVTTPQIAVKLEDPKAAIKEFSRSSLSDIDCFAKTLDRVETDLGTMKTRANAWAEGDVEALRRLPFPDQDAACTSALMNAAILQSKDQKDLPTRAIDAWLAAAEAALANNQVTFAALPMEDLLRPGGYVATLGANGYVVEEPK